MTRRELRQELGARELDETLAYYINEPSPPRRIVHMLAQLTMVVHNVWSEDQKDLEDFIPEWSEGFLQKEEEEEARWERQLRKVERLNEMFGGEDNR